VRGIVFAIAVVTVLVVACDSEGGSSGPSGTATVEPASAEALCRFANDRVAGRVEPADLVEISGIAASRKQQNIEIAGTIWAHNDSGDTARFFAIDADGGRRDVFNLVGAEAIDWEDMAVGPGPEEGVSYIYLADIGDNNSQRQNVVVYRLPEPTVSHDSPEVPAQGEPAPAEGTPANPDITGYDTLTLRYPDGAHDAETLLIDPVDGDLVIVTKNIATGVSQVFRGDALAPEGDQTLEQVEEIHFDVLKGQIGVPFGAGPLVAGLPHIPTGGDVSPDGSLIAIRTYGAVLVWERSEGGPLWERLDEAPCQASSSSEQQGEAIAFNASGTGYITISEGPYQAINESVLE
jgi:hypothetical protein